jgi:hypothetical protein
MAVLMGSDRALSRNRALSPKSPAGFHHRMTFTDTRLYDENIYLVNDTD